MGDELGARLRAISRRTFLRNAALASALLPGAGALLAACGGEEGGGERGGGKIRIARTSPPLITYPSDVWGPITFGEEFGLHVSEDDYLTFESHSTAVQTLLSGRADVLVGSLLANLSTFAAQPEFRVFGPSIDLDDFILAGIGDVDSCQDVFDPNTIVSSDSPGGSGSAVMEAILLNDCGRSMTEIQNIRVLESSSLRATALASGDVEVSVIHIDQAVMVRRQVGEENFNEIGALYNVENFIRSAWGAPVGWLDENPESAAAPVASVFKAHREMMFDFAVFKKAVKEVVDEPPEEEWVYKNVWNLARKYRFWPINAEESLWPKGIEFMGEIGVSLGLFDEAPDPDEVVDRRAIERAEEMVGPMTREELLG